MNPASGELLLASSLDFDSGDTSFLFLLRVTDAKGQFHTIDISMTITNVNDLAPTCSEDVYVFNPLEATHPVTWTLACSDPEGETLTYVVTTA